MRGLICGIYGIHVYLYRERTLTEELMQDPSYYFSVVAGHLSLTS